MEQPLTDYVISGKSCARRSVTLRGLVTPACRAVPKARLNGHDQAPQSGTGSRKLSQGIKGVLELHAGKHLT